MKVLSSVLCLVLSIIAFSPAVAADRFDDGLRAVVAGADPLKIARDHGFAVRDGRVQVVAVTPGDDTVDLEEWLLSNGALYVVAVRGRVQAFVPPAVLGELGQRPDVAFVERPIYGELPEPPPPAALLKQTTLAVTSEAMAAMNAPAWNAAGYSGEGVRVGIIDVQFGGWEELVGVELPPAERTTYRAFGGASVVAGEVHGTACAEIVHDVAPDAHIFLAHIRSLNDLFSAFDWLDEQGADVATMSIGWYGTGPGDGTGRTADEITAFIAASDALVLTSAGNERRSHWQGPTTDGDGNDWVDFSPGDDLNELSSSMSAGDRVAVSIVWDDWDSPSSNYSLHLFNLDGTEPVEVAVSDRPQSGQSWQTPFEQISYTAPDGGRFGVRISRSGVVGSNEMELFSLDSDLNDRVGEGSLTIPSDSVDVVAVGAVNYNAPYAYRSFSSAGPSNGPGGTFAGGATKPDLSGFDGVSTASYGTRGFFGTSAASPHAAGAAVLIRDAEPGLDHAQTRTFLESRALDLGVTGKDNDYGWGRVFLGQTPGSACTFSISPEGATVSSSGGGGIVQVTTEAGCPWTVSSQADWLTVAPATGTGPGVVGFTAAANPSAAPRSAVLVIAGLSFGVTQAGSGCTFTLSPTSQSISSAGGDGLFSVQTEAGCSWTASTDQGWIVLTVNSGSGTGSVIYTVAVNESVESRVGAITVADKSFSIVQEGASTDITYVVAGIAETEGAAQTRWKSDLAILNPGESVVQVELEYRHDTGAAQSSLSVAPGGIVELPNVAVETFGVPDSAGAVELTAATELIVTARTFNDAPDGTFGQFLPGVREDDGLTGVDVAVLSQLSSGFGLRTNIGFVDLGGQGATARIRLFDGSGDRVGSQLAVAIPAGGWFQVNRVFREADAGACSGCYALIDLAGGQGPVWAYASVVDNASGDPTTIPEVPVGAATPAGDRRFLVAGIAETDGANQTTWKSNLALLNLSGHGVTADLTYRHGGGSEGSSLTLADGELHEFQNIAAELFGVPGSAGSVDVDADGTLVVTARTFNESSDGTFGQYLPGLDESAALTPGDDGYLSQLKSSDAFRTNIGFTNYGETECAVRILLYDDQGVRKGQMRSTVPAGGWTQVNRVFETAGVGSCPLGYAVVRVLTGGCEVWAYGSVVDNGSGDPTTVPVVIR